MDETDDDPGAIAGVSTEMNQLLGLFDAPAFVRRGQDTDYALGRLHARCRRERDERLEMVRLRLRQWSSVTRDPEGGCLAFPGTFAVLAELSGWASVEPAERDAPLRRQRAVARDLIAAVARFNRRWGQFVEGLPLDPVNLMIEQYNRYYVLEKECSLGSAKLAARHFRPKALVSRDGLLAAFPLLPVPELLAGP